MYSDGNGLNLRVERPGTKQWVQRVTIAGKRSMLGLGGYPAVSLADARELAAANQRAVKQGRDPLAEKRQAAEERRRPAVPSFSEAAERVIEMRRPTWSNAKHAAQWTSTLATYAHPVIGRKPVDEITTGDVLTIMTPIWTTKPETASRVRQRLETVFDWVVAQGWRPDNPAGRAITRALPRVSRVKRHHAALPVLDVPAALKTVRESGADLATRLAFEFLALTAARSNEARLATWREMDLQSATWKAPAERMKARREHKVPLSGRSLEILGEARELNGHDTELVFPAGRRGKTLSDMTLTVLLRRLGIPAVPHGFRSSFKDWCMEVRGGDDRWFLSEAALAHNLGGPTQMAYARSDLLELRRPLMDEWAEFLSTP
jgi:integrase